MLGLGFTGFGVYRLLGFRGFGLYRVWGVHGLGFRVYRVWGLGFKLGECSSLAILKLQ